jgi:hypothetical protein
MPTPRPANRSYSTEALERWFASLPEDWESVFKPADLAEGRRIYTEGLVRSLELKPQSAVLDLRVKRPWPALRRVFCLDDSPYFASQRLVFVGDKAAAPPPDDARMLCFHPHGMLCCGWTVANAGAALRSAGVTCVPSFGNSRRTAVRAYARFPVSLPAAGSPRTCCSCCLA